MISTHSFVRSFGLGCVTEVRKRSNETWLKIDYGQLHIRIEGHVAKTSLFCAFEISPRENFGTEATDCVPQKTLQLLRDLMRDTESTSARIQTDNFCASGPAGVTESGMRYSASPGPIARGRPR